MIFYNSVMLVYHFPGPLQFSESELYEFNFEKMVLIFLAIISANYKN